VLAKKEAGRPITSEDYYNLDRLVGGVEGKIIASRAAAFEAERKVRAEARKAIPDQAWQLPLDVLDLPGRIHNLLLDAEIETLGALMMTLSLGEDAFLNIKGLGEKALEVVQEHLTNFDGWDDEAVAELEAEAVVEEAEAMPATAELEAEVEEAEAVVEAVELEPEVEEEPVVEAVVEETAEAAETEAAEEELEPVLDDLTQSLIDTPVVKAPPKQKQEPKPAVVIARPTAPEVETEEERRRGRKGKQLVLDEETGEVVVKRKRKGSRRRPEWEEYDIDDF